MRAVRIHEHGAPEVLQIDKLPVPVPSEVVLPVIVGLTVVLQHTPRAVTGAPPSAVTFPPLSAELEVTLVTAAVETVGTTALAVNCTSLP